MKQSLGRIIGLVMMLNTMVLGMHYQWSVLESPQSLRVGQSGVIRYACSFEGSAAEYSTKLKLIDSPQYATSILSEKSQVTKGKRTDTIDLLVTPKTSGALTMQMRATIRYTSPGAVENTVLGRDNLSKDDIKEEEVQLPVVSIKAEENNAALTGNITMETRVDSTSVRAHEPIHLSIIIKGSGNLDKFTPYTLNISRVKIFAEPPQKLFSPSKDGFTGEIRQEFALVAEKPYVIPPVSLNVFDTAQKRPKILQSAPVSIEISEGYNPSSLLDPPDVKDFAALKQYVLYGFLVLIGMALGQGARWAWKHRPRRRKKQWWDKIKTQKELILMLALDGDKRYEKILIDLETNAINLDEAKNKLNKLTSINKVKV